MTWQQKHHLSYQDMVQVAMLRSTTSLSSGRWWKMARSTFQTQTLSTLTVWAYHIFWWETMPSAWPRTWRYPYSQRDLFKEQRILNYRLSRVRRVFENAFWVLSNRFQVLASKMNHLPSTVRIIIKTCFILYNLMRMRYPAMNKALVGRDERRDNLVSGA